ncbi:MAG: MBL fold metallo-hydrolase [Candidatus Thorarchaeota archaeon]
MMRSRNSKILLGVIIGALVVSTPILFLMLSSQPPANEINVRLLITTGVMIEAKGVRIYIDPYFIPSNYSDLPADVILITHPHGDHYSPSDIGDILTNDTVFVCPNNMTDAIERFDGLGVDPGDSFLVGEINFTAFRMYMPDYPSGLDSGHPKAANWTSFIIDIDGFRIYHAGDAKYMEELEELTGTIDLAFLPIYWDTGYGPLNESLLPIVDAIDLLQPKTTIPTHFFDIYRETFITEYSILVQSPDCEILNLEYWTTCTYELDANNT